MRFLMVVMGGAALAFIAASGLMNWVFMSSLGKSEFERQILGAVSVAVSVFIASLPTLLIGAWRDRRFGYVSIGVPVFLGFLAFSMTSAVGFSAKNRGSISEERGLATTRLADVKKEIAAEDAKKAALGSPRLLAVIQQAMHGLELDRKWQASGECKEPTTEAMRSFCKGYFDLKGEAARSTELTAVEAKIEGLKREARQYEDKGAGREADNQAAIIGRVTGLNPVDVEEKLTLFLALLVEVGAASGWFFATSHMRERGEETAPASSVATIIIDGKALKGEPVVKRDRAPVKQLEKPKQIAGPRSRRVPPVKKIAAK